MNFASGETKERVHRRGAEGAEVLGFMNGRERRRFTKDPALRAARFSAVIFVWHRKK
jgi:hypothetical protein